MANNRSGSLLTLTLLLIITYSRMNLTAALAINQSHSDVSEDDVQSALLPEESDDVSPLAIDSSEDFDDVDDDDDDDDDDSNDLYTTPEQQRISSFFPGAEFPYGYYRLSGKRNPRLYSFGLGKRQTERSPLNSVETQRASRSNLEGPTTRFSFGLGKRSDPSQRFGFGLGKRSDPSQRFGFGLGKRDDVNQRFGFGLGKRSDASHRFGFGLGKRNTQKPRFGFGLGKRSNQLVELMDQLQLKDEQAEQVSPYVGEGDMLLDKRASLMTFPPVASNFNFDVDPMTPWSDKRPFSEYKKRTRFMLGKNLPVYNFGLGK